MYCTPVYRPVLHTPAQPLRFHAVMMQAVSIEASKARFTWGLKSRKELENMVSGLTWAEDVSLVEGMKELYPVYKLLGWIQPVKNLSNKLVILRK